MDAAKLDDRIKFWVAREEELRKAVKTIIDPLKRGEVGAEHMHASRVVLALLRARNAPAKGEALFGDDVDLIELQESVDPPVSPKPIRKFSFDGKV
jgi:hypothetical protein